MAIRKRKPGNNPISYRCANPACTREHSLPLDKYGEYPLPTTAPQKIHRVCEPDMGSFSLQCPACAHYTLVSPKMAPSREDA